MQDTLWLQFNALLQIQADTFVTLHRGMKKYTRQRYFNEKSESPDLMQTENLI